MQGVVLDHPRFYYDHGLCQTFRPDPAAEELPPPGETRGYKFHFMYIPCEDPVGEYEEGEELLPGGMDVFIHDALEWWTGGNKISSISSMDRYTVYLQFTFSCAKV